MISQNRMKPFLKSILLFLLLDYELFAVPNNNALVASTHFLTSKVIDGIVGAMGCL